MEKNGSGCAYIATLMKCLTTIDQPC